MEDQDMDDSQATSPGASPSHSESRAARTRARTRFRNQRTLWTTRMERSLLKALLEAKRDGLDASNNNFRSGAWIAAIEQAQRWTPQRLTREICDNRWRKIKFQWKLWQQHKQNVSSSWILDERRKTYVPKDQETAIEYFEKHPEMKIFRDTGPSHVDIVSHLLDGKVGFARNSEEYQQAIENLDKEEQRPQSVELISDDSPQPSTPVPPTPRPPTPPAAQSAQPAQPAQSTQPAQPAQSAQTAQPSHPAAPAPPATAATAPPQPPPAPSIPVNWTPIHHYPPPRQPYHQPPPQPQQPPPPPPPQTQPQMHTEPPRNLERQFHALYNILQATDIQRIGKGLSDICMALGSITQVLEDPCQKAVTLFLAESSQLFPEWQDPAQGRVPFSRCRAVLQALQSPGASNVYLALHHVRPQIDRREYVIELLRERGMM